MTQRSETDQERIGLFGRRKKLASRRMLTRWCYLSKTEATCTAKIATCAMGSYEFVLIIKTRRRSCNRIFFTIAPFTSAIKCDRRRGEGAKTESDATTRDGRLRYIIEKHTGGSRHSAWEPHKCRHPARGGGKFNMFPSISCIFLRRKSIAKLDG